MVASKSERITELRNVEKEIVIILKNNSRMDPNLLREYKALLHKARMERLRIQIDNTSVIVEMKTNGDVKIKPGLFNSTGKLPPIGHTGQSRFKSFKPIESHAAVVTKRNLKVGEDLQKNMNALQKGLAVDVGPDHEVRKKDWRKREQSRK